MPAGIVCAHRAAALSRKAARSTSSTARSRAFAAFYAANAEDGPAYVEAGYALALGQAVYDRRAALGLSQTELARRAGMTQPQISTIEGGDPTPTLPLLTRLAKALNASLT